jgi:hypothetical protein
MGWMPMLTRLWKVVTGYWSRLSNMQSGRVNKRMALWACTEDGLKCKNLFHKVKTKFNECDFEMLVDLNMPTNKHALQQAVVPYNK